ncbi:MAG: PAS domain S-box protein [Thermodesulfobacteriota bacterium]|nr:PAS domain S-box protein [Thermodesulfobacteriota bacterium]
MENMFDIILEITQFIIISAIILFLHTSSKKEHIPQHAGWRYIKAGFALILFGVFVDITDNFSALDRFIIIGDTPYQAFLEKVIGYLLGFFLLAIGLWKWMPNIIKLRETENRLKKLYKELEHKVKERTAELNESNINFQLEIEERKRSEDALRESETKYKTLVQNIPGMVYSALPDWSTKFLSGSERICGYTSDEIDSKKDKWLSLIHLDDKERVFRQGSELTKVPKNMVQIYRIITKDGNVCWVEDYKTSLFSKEGEFIGIEGTVYDITSLKQAKDELKNEKTFIDNMLDTITDGFLVIDLEGKILRWNKTISQVTGYSDEEISLMQATDFFSGEDIQLVIDNIGIVLQEGHASNQASVVTKEGKSIPYEFTGDLFRDHEGNPLNICAVGRDITERIHAENALRKSEEKYRDLVENMNEVIFTVDKSGFLVYVSPAIESILGYSPSEVIGKSIQEIIYKADLKLVMGRFQKALAGIKVPTEYRVYKKSGEICWVYSSSKPVFDEKGVYGLQGLLTDIDDRKRAEEEKKGLEKKLVRSQKMEALGILAGGVAHDLNNVLSGIINYPELLLMTLPEESPMRKPLQAIMNSGLKSVAIVQDLLDLTRRGVIVNETLNLNDIVSDHLRSPENKKVISYHPGVDIETNLEPDLLNIIGSPVHLKKAVMNLLSNAAEALSGGGRIIISTENRYVDSPIKGYDHIDEGDFAVLRIQDNGTGIAVEDLQNIFEPFYTKKEMGRSGTGLGMTIVWNTVQDHQGYINLESTVGKGTAFELYFPVTREEIAKEKVSISLKDYIGKGETILVVDDIKEQREIAFQMLKTLGYFVTSVSSGEEAVEYIKNNSADLLVLDMIMDPGMDGLDTYQKILEIHPGQKAIVASGFSETDRVKEVQRLGAGAYIKKPYTFEKIGLALKTELER